MCCVSSRIKQRSWAKCLSLVFDIARSQEEDAYRGRNDLREALYGSVKHTKRHDYSDTELRYATLQKTFVEVNMFVS